MKEVKHSYVKTFSIVDTVIYYYDFRPRKYIMTIFLGDPSPPARGDRAVAPAAAAAPGRREGSGRALSARPCWKDPGFGGQNMLREQPEKNIIYIYIYVYIIFIYMIIYVYYIYIYTVYQLKSIKYEFPGST